MTARALKRIFRDNESKRFVTFATPAGSLRFRNAGVTVTRSTVLVTGEYIDTRSIIGVSFADT